MLGFCFVFVLNHFLMFLKKIYTDIRARMCVYVCGVLYLMVNWAKFNDPELVFLVFFCRHEVNEFLFLFVFFF